MILSNRRVHREKKKEKFQSALQENNSIILLNRITYEWLYIFFSNIICVKYISLHEK